MAINKEIEKARNEIIELANNLCPYKGDDFNSESELTKKDAENSVKRRVWIDGFLKGIATMQDVQKASE